MVLRVRVAWVLVVLSVGGWPAAAQTCSTDIVERTLRLTRLTACLSETGKTLGTCIDEHQQAMRESRLGRVTSLNASGEPVRTTDNLDTLLIALHNAYQSLKKDASIDCERAALRDLGEMIHEALKQAGLNQPLNAIFRTGYSLADAGDENPTRFEASAPTLSSTGQVFVEFESKHAGDDSPPFDLGFGGSFGLGPVIAIASLRPAETDEGEGGDAAEAAAETPEEPDPPRLVPAAVTALTWSLNVRPSFQTTKASELSLVGRFGQSRLDSMTVKLGDGDDAALADVIRNGNGRWAWFREAGIEWRFFEKPLTTIHHTKDMLLPMFQFGAGLRWDNRLKASGPLEGVEKAKERLYLKFGVNLVKIFNGAPGEDPDKDAFSLKLSIDHQWARKSDTMPSATRLLIEASADVLKMFNLGDKEKKAEEEAKEADEARKKAEAEAAKLREDAEKKGAPPQPEGR